MSTEKQVIKFSDEDLKKVKETNYNFQKNMLDLGEIAISRIDLNDKISELDKREEELIKQYQQLQEQSAKLGEELSKKYGVGVLNVDTGEYTLD